MSEALPANKLSRLSNAFTLERRFDKNYEVSDEIGIGGFAKVFKAKNLLDNIDYAMKKIVIKTKNKTPQMIVNEIHSILTEIRCFAKIKHKHIVRYNHSWIEIDLKNEEEDKILKSLQNNRNKQKAKSKRSISNDYSRSHVTESDLYNESHISNGSSVDKSELDYTFDLSYQIEENEDNSHNDIKEHDITKSNNDSLLELNDICSSYQQEQKEKEHSNHENPKDQYSFLLKNFEKRTKNIRKTSNFSKKSKENPEHLDKRKEKNNNEYQELKFNQHKENIHKFKDEFNHAKERKKQNNIRNRNNNNNNRDHEEEPKNEVKIIINNTEYNVSQIKKITLILQMELCKETLENFIYRRNNDKDLQKLIDEQAYTFEYKYYLKNLKIFLEIAKALNYLHTKQNIIHRDLKPQNIFFSFEDLIKIGDFGLATDFYNEKYYNSKDIESLKNFRKNSTESNNTEFDNFSLSNPSITNENTICYHTKNIGTFLYASPEQLNVNFYDYKSDIYSLGFILYELLCPFRTSMERKVRFSELKSGKIIDFLKEQNKTITDLIISMTDTDPNKRPDALRIIEIIKEEINRIKILNFPNDIEEYGKLGRIGSRSSKDSNENSQNSDITEESSSIVNNNKSSTYFQDEDSKVIKENNRSNFVNLTHAVNDSFHLKPNYYKAESLNDMNNLCNCGKIDLMINNNNKKENKDINNEYFNSQNNNSNTNATNLWEQKPKSSGFLHHDIFHNSGIHIKVCFYEGDHIPIPNATDINAISYKNYMNSIHIKKYLKIIKNKLMIFSDENSKKADQIYEMEDCDIIYDSDFENENKPEYQIFIVHPYLKNISLYFNTYSEYFNFVEFFSNNQN